jgi:hypothetical protein
MINSLLIFSRLWGWHDCWWSPIKSTFRFWLVNPHEIPIGISPLLVINTYQYISYMFMYSNIYIYPHILQPDFSVHPIISPWNPFSLGFIHTIIFRFGMGLMTVNCIHPDQLDILHPHDSNHQHHGELETNTIYSQNISPLGQLGGAVAVTQNGITIWFFRPPQSWDISPITVVIPSGKLTVCYWKWP